MIENIEEAIGNRIEKLRTEHNESQSELANAIDITQQTLSLYEKGKRATNVLTLRKIALHYEVSTDYLLGLSENEQPDIEQEVKIFKVITKQKEYCFVYQPDAEKLIQALLLLQENFSFSVSTELLKESEIIKLS